jgi:hypothetical protein
MGDNLVPNGLSMVCGWQRLMRSMAMPSRSHQTDRRERL